MQLSSPAADPSSVATEPPGVPPGAACRAGTPLVCLRAAAVGYGQRPVLTEVDFCVDAGEAVAVLGPNGAGKSTLIRGILGLADVLGGSVEVCGLPRSSFRDWHRLGYVPQNHSVSTGIPSTVSEVVSSGRLARKRIARPFSAADRRAVASAIDTVGLSDRARHPMATLSGGQQRRVLIARALAGEPDLLVLDEPTAGVDAESRAVLAETLARLVAGGTAILFVTHELGEMGPVITRAVVIENGRITYDGAPLPERGHGALTSLGTADCEHLDPHGGVPEPFSGFRLSTNVGHRIEVR